MSEANAAVLSESDGYKHILAALAAHSSSGSVLEHVLLVSAYACIHICTSSMTPTTSK